MRTTAFAFQSLVHVCFASLGFGFVYAVPCTLNSLGQFISSQAQTTYLIPPPPPQLLHTFGANAVSHAE